MKRVLREQHVASRSARRDKVGSYRSTRQRDGSERAKARVGRGRRDRDAAVARTRGRFRTGLLLLVVLAVCVALVVLVPALEDASPVTGENLLLATAPELPSLQDGLVAFELADDTDYIVAEGETLSEIASRFDIGYRELAEYNDLVNPDAITAGQRITIPGTLSRRLDPEE